MRSTPVVAHGCVYVGFGQGYLGDRGDVVALDAKTGELVWHVRLNASVLGLTVANGMVYAAPSAGTRGDVALPVVTDTYAPAGSYAIGIDARSGESALDERPPGRRQRRERHLHQRHPGRLHGRGATCCSCRCPAGRATAPGCRCTSWTRAPARRSARRTR